MAFKPANCPSCGGALQIPDDRDVVNCMYCDTSIVVREVLRVTVSSNLENLYRLAETASNARNYDEAYTYFTRILEEDGTSSRAWFGKGVAAGWQSNLTEFKMREMVSCLRNAREFAGDDKKGDYEKKSADSINAVSFTCYSLSRQHLNAFVSIDNTWGEYLDRCFEILSFLDIAHACNPTDRTIIENFIHICKDNIDGISFYDDIREKFVTKGVTPKYKSMLMGRMHDAVSKLQKIDPTYQPPQLEKASSCFGCLMKQIGCLFLLFQATLVVMAIAVANVP
ncbi:MAG: hypothetical protein ACKVH8_24805 [Pirellulales bacterium]